MYNYINDKNMNDFLTSCFVEDKFSEYSLRLSLKDMIDVSNNYIDYSKYYDLDELCNKLAFSSNDIMAILSNEYKSNIVKNYLYGENGIAEISEDEKKNYFIENFLGMKYCIWYLTDTSGNKIKDTELELKRRQAQECFDKLKENKINFEQAIELYSEAYTSEEIINRYEGENKDILIDQNNSLVNDIILIDSQGQGFPDMQWNIGEELADEIKSANTADIVYYETSDAVWIIKKYEISDLYVNYQSALNDKISEYKWESEINKWIESLKYTVNQDVIIKYDPRYLTEMKLK